MFEVLISFHVLKYMRRDQLRRIRLKYLDMNSDVLEEITYRDSANV